MEENKVSKKVAGKIVVAMLVELIILGVLFGVYVYVSQKECTKECTCNNQTNETSKPQKEAEKCAEDEDVTVNVKTLSKTYVNIYDETDFITFKEDGTFEAHVNNCEGYDKDKGKYTIEGSKIILDFSGEKYELIIKDSGLDHDYKTSIPYLLFDKEEAVNGCAFEKFFILENLHDYF